MAVGGFVLKENGIMEYCLWEFVWGEIFVILVRIILYNCHIIHNLLISNMLNESSPVSML